MLSRAVLFSVLVALSEARFGQEQIPIAAIQAVTSGGAPGQAATLAGQTISTLLAAANPCAKLQQADLIVATLGTGADSIKAAQGLVAAEQNFNPFVVNVPSICSDPTLPTTAALRGIVPLVDPAVGGSATENANSATSLKTPFSNAGLSVAQVMAAAGFSNFTTKAASGAAGAAAGAAKSPVAGASSAVSSAAAAVVPSSSSTSGPTTLATVAVAAKSPAASPGAASGASSTKAAAVVAGGTGAASAKEAASSSATVGVFPGFQASTIAGLDFGLCTPTMKFEAGLNGRAVTESTFQAIDPIVNKGQQEALNPNIITNRICDQLTNVCNANAAAKTACTAAKAQIAALGTRNAATADAWNTALGFAGTNTNPDNAPQPGLIGHA